MRVGTFLALQTPLIARRGPGPIVVLAFGLTAGWLRGGRLVAYCIDPSGGPASWWPAADIDYPSPIQSGPTIAREKRTIHANN